MQDLMFMVQVNPEQSTAIQRAIFEKGGKWADGTTYVRHLDKPFLVVRGGMITWLPSLDTDIPQWFAHQALMLIETRTSLKPPYVVDDREDRVAVRENTRTSPSVLDEATPGLIYLWKLGKTTMYNRQEDSTTHYRNEHRHDILASAYKMCDELNQKGA